MCVVSGFGSGEADVDCRGGRIWLCVEVFGGSRVFSGCGDGVGVGRGERFGVAFVFFADLGVLFVGWKFRE